MLIKGKGCPWNSVPECVDGIKISPFFEKLAYVFVKKGGSSLCLIKVCMQKDLCIHNLAYKTVFT